MTPNPLSRSRLIESQKSLVGIISDGNGCVITEMSDNGYKTIQAVLKFLLEPEVTDEMEEATVPHLFDPPEAFKAAIAKLTEEIP